MQKKTERTKVLYMFELYMYSCYSAIAQIKCWIRYLDVYGRIWNSHFYFSAFVSDVQNMDYYFYSGYTRAWNKTKLKLKAHNLALKQIDTDRYGKIIAHIGII